MKFKYIVKVNIMNNYLLLYIISFNFWYFYKKIFSSRLLNFVYTLSIQCINIRSFLYVIEIILILRILKILHVNIAILHNAYAISYQIIKFFYSILANINNDLIIIAFLSNQH